MLWMLDTKTASFVIRRRPPAVKARFDAVGHGNLAISVIVFAELLYGAERHPTRGVAIRREIDDFRRRLKVMPWSEQAAAHSAGIRVDLRKAGTPIGNMDLLIAAHARAQGATLVTNTLSEFRRVDGLTVEDWLDAVDQGG